jgi:hypothetical protein
MKETTLWQHIDHPLQSHGRFQKISDRFSIGVPDVLGCCRWEGVTTVKTGIPVAMELKELSGVGVVKTKFRPGQLDWLRDWELGGGVSLVLTTWGHTVYGFRWNKGWALECGLEPSSLRKNCLFEFPKGPRGATWRDFVTFVLVPLLRAAGRGPSRYSMVGDVPLLLRPDLGPARGSFYSGSPRNIASSS